MRTEQDIQKNKADQNGKIMIPKISQDNSGHSLSLHIHIIIIYIRGNKKENPSTNHKISVACSCEDSSHTQPRWTCGLTAGRASKGRRYDHALDFLTPHHLNLTFLTYFDNELNLSMNIYMWWNQGGFLHRRKLFYNILYISIYYTLLYLIYVPLSLFFLSIVISPYFSYFLYCSGLICTACNLRSCFLGVFGAEAAQWTGNEVWGGRGPRGAEIPGISRIGAILFAHLCTLETSRNWRAFVVF